MKLLIILLIILFVLFVLVTIIGFFEPKFLKITFASLKKTSIKSVPQNPASNEEKEYDRDSFRYVREDYYYKEKYCPFFVGKDNFPSKRRPDGKCRILFFSDIHAEWCKVKPEAIIAAIEKYKETMEIDAVVFGGDTCNKQKTSYKGINFFKTIADYLKANNIRFMGVTGNHDLVLTEEQIRSCGYINLSDEIVTIEKEPAIEGGKTVKFNFGGIYDTGRKNRKWLEPNIASKVKNSDGNERNILVVHNPDWILHRDNSNIDYMLSGHFHGGQFCLPFNIQNYTIRKDKLPRKGVVSGIYDAFGTEMFISRGVGCIFVPFRLRAFPEITYIEIE